MILKRLAPAKINLGLHVLRKRPDGYHDLETVFLRIPWADTVSVRQAQSLSLTCSDATLTTDETNLVMKAARRLAAACDVDQGAALHLEKVLPYGAGLGGGSSDAASTLRLLVDFWKLEISESHLHRLAAELGSDVPFFLGSEAAYGTGRGEELTPLRDPFTHDPYRFPFSLVVVVPPVHISTADAYARIRPNEQQRPDLCSLILSNDLTRWCTDLVNDFEESIFPTFPSVQAVKEQLYELGAGYAAMSGSGSAVFGIFAEKEEATAAAETMVSKGHRVWPHANNS